jgi:mRNA interferase RelE/StbE
VPIEIISRINPSIEALAEEPRPTGCVKLKGKLNRWRIRVGDYRIIYSIDDKTFTINILAGRHRREAYDR